LVSSFLIPPALNSDLVVRPSAVAGTADDGTPVGGDLDPGEIYSKALDLEGTARVLGALRRGAWVDDLI
jgi:hypothetical protein